ncbi:inositol-3-phosphate synthase [Amycolatopsis sp. NPDC021455]|uniref:inositol-3-phosphate synthase n=1 Tax=Amycolatopsis sp. NPDC021455 TaxID=3154901 RepID=UPI0033E9EA8A
MVQARVAVAGVGNNISALVQGVRYYEGRSAGEDPELPGIRRPVIGALRPHDVEFVAAYDVSPAKIGLDVADAILAGKNNYPRLDVTLPATGVCVEPGIREHDPDADVRRVTESLRRSGAEVLVYSLPTGLQWAATAYATAAAAAGVALVNCTPELVSRDQRMLDAFVAAGVPVLGDDLASHFGASIVHRSLLALLRERGITLDQTYQINIGGNEDFRNLREHGESKKASKLNAIAQDGLSLDRVDIIPSGGYVAGLRDQKVAYVSLDGIGWAGTPVNLELRLRVQDSSNAAGVIIDLVRIAVAARRIGLKGFVPAAAALLKSPPDGHGAYSQSAVNTSFEELDAAAESRSAAE